MIVFSFLVVLIFTGNFLLFRRCQKKRLIGRATPPTDTFGVAPQGPAPITGDVADHTWQVMETALGSHVAVQLTPNVLYGSANQSRLVENPTYTAAGGNTASVPRTLDLNGIGNGAIYIGGSAPTNASSNDSNLAGKLPVEKNNHYDVGIPPAATGTAALELNDSDAEYSYIEEDYC